MVALPLCGPSKVQCGAKQPARKIRNGFPMVEAYGTVLVSGLVLYEDIDVVLGQRAKRIVKIPKAAAA